MAKKKLSDSEILSLLSDGVKAGVKFNNTKLSIERQRVLKYYNAELPAPVHGGNSKYVSTDVFDCVESMKSTLLETFSAHSDIVQFSPDNDDPMEKAQADQATALTKHVVFEQNDGIAILDTSIHDGLMSRVAIAKVYWDSRVEEIEEEFDAISEDELNVLLEDDAIELKFLEIDPDTGTYSGELCRKNDVSQVRIDVIPSEEFIVRPDIKSLDREQLTHRTEKTKSDLLKEGFNRKKVEELCRADHSLSEDMERINRFTSVADIQGEFNRDEASRKYVINETHDWLDIDGEGTTKLWRIVWCGSVLFEKECVERHSYITFTPLPIPHSFYGGNFAAKVIPVQNAKTVLTRSILDHAVIANNPRYGVVKGALTNPRELLDNRIGGLVNVTRQDGIFPLPQAPLNPFVFQTIEMLDSDKEDVSGVSRLSQGLNKDAISNQNSQGMVEQLIGNSMQRQKTIARAFATQFLKPMFLEVYRLLMENADKEFIVDVAGKYVPVDPRKWTKLRTVSIDLRLGYGEKERLAQEYMMFGQALAQDPVAGPAFGYEQRRALYKVVMEAKGHKDIAQFLPEEAPEPQPDPTMMAELDKLKAETDAIKSREQRADAEAKASIEVNELRADFEQRFKTMEMLLKDRDADRKDDEVENRIEVSQTEMELARKAQADAPEANQKASAIISPNG